MDLQKSGSKLGWTESERLKSEDRSVRSGEGKEKGTERKNGGRGVGEEAGRLCRLCLYIQRLVSMKLNRAISSSHTEDITGREEGCT